MSFDRQLKLHDAGAIDRRERKLFIIQRFAIIQILNNCKIIVECVNPNPSRCDRQCPVLALQRHVWCSRLEGLLTIISVGNSKRARRRQRPILLNGSDSWRSGRNGGNIVDTCNPDYARGRHTCETIGNFIANGNFESFACWQNFKKRCARIQCQKTAIDADTSRFCRNSSITKLDQDIRCNERLGIQIVGIVE